MPNLAALRTVLDIAAASEPGTDGEPSSRIRELPLGSHVHVHPDGEANAAFYDGVRLHPFTRRPPAAREAS